jgi:hypothetical protein
MIGTIIPELFVDGRFIPLERGVNRSTIRAMIGGDVGIFVKSPTYSLIPTDDFKKGIHVYYNEENNIVGYEAFDYQKQIDVAIGSISLLYTGWPLLRKQLEDAKIPYTIEQDGYGITIGNDLTRLYIPDIEEVEEYPVEVKAVYVPLDEDPPMNPI